MNWKQFGKAQMLTESKYLLNIFHFMRIMELDYRLWETQQKYWNTCRGHEIVVNILIDEQREIMKQIESSARDSNVF